MQQETPLYANRLCIIKFLQIPFLYSASVLKLETSVHLVTKARNIARSVLKEYMDLICKLFEGKHSAPSLIYLESVRVG